jgi:phospholipid-translocating ATPase
LLAFAETAINIGYSCKLLTDELEEIYVLDADSKESVRNQLEEKQRDMHKKLSEVSPDSLPNDVSVANGGTPAKLTAASLPEDFGGFAIIINGHSLVSFVSPLCENKQTAISTGASSSSLCSRAIKYGYYYNSAASA